MYEISIIPGSDQYPATAVSIFNGAGIRWEICIELTPGVNQDLLYQV
jgi:hypothetical protein